MKHALWTYWENPKGVTIEPAYITLCRWTMLYNLKDTCLISVTPENLDNYLPGVSNKIQDIQAHDRGRLDRFKRLFRGDPRSLAVKCDFVRTQLLKRYGGIYIDSDAIILSDITHYFNLLNDSEFLIVRRESHNKNHVSVNFYGSRPMGKVITSYSAAQLDKLENKTVFDYTELGDATLNPLADQYSEDICFIPEREIQVVTCEEAEEVFLDDELRAEDVLSGSESVFMLSNKIFRNQLRDYDVSQLYYGDILVSKIFRKALPEDAFNKFMNGSLI